jgi:AcrR family transcriptional regulator
VNLADPLPGTRRERVKARRKAIMDAALACFTEKGYEAATIDEIRRRAGASVGSMYHHFKGKEELAVAISVEASRDYREGFLATLTEHETAEEGLRATVAYHLRWVSQNPGQGRFLLSPPSAGVQRTSNEMVFQENQLFLAQVWGWLSAQVRRGVIREVPLWVYSALWLGPSFFVTSLWLEGLMGLTTTSLESMTDTLADAAWAALRA